MGRRFAQYGEVPVDPEHPEKGTFTLVDDYGHHPHEMAATIAAARGAWPEKRLVLAFQPHRYTRTRDCFEDFIKVLSQVDRLVLADVYPPAKTPFRALAAATSRACSDSTAVTGSFSAKARPKCPQAVRSDRAGGRRGAHDGGGQCGARAAGTLRQDHLTQRNEKEWISQQRLIPSLWAASRC